METKESRDTRPNVVFSDFEHNKLQQPGARHLQVQVHAPHRLKTNKLTPIAKFAKFAKAKLAKLAILAELVKLAKLAILAKLPILTKSAIFSKICNIVSF
jgi:hypothetical protein